jgi:hypothetical protein
MPSDRIDYQRFIEDALRDAVRRLLAEVAEHGLPGEHYLYIGFETSHPGVVMPRSLRDLYPGEMTMILQHQYWNLQVDAGSFAVELSFSGSRQRLSIPFAAMTTFADPSAELALRFRPPAPAAGPQKAQRGQKARTTEKAEKGVKAGPGAAGSGPARVAPAAKATGSEAAAAAPVSRRDVPAGVIRFDPSRRK